MNTWIVRGIRLVSIGILVGTLSSAGPILAQSSTDMVLDWNGTTLKTTAAAAFNPPLESRNVAIVHAAMFDAVNSILGEFHPYAVEVIAPPGASPDAAAAAAAHFALVHLYSAQQEMLDDAYEESLASIPDGQARIDGIAVGETAAARILLSRASDGAAEAIGAPYAPPVGPGFWKPTPPASLPALDPGWGSVRPFLLKKGAQFRPGPPPALKGSRYARDFDEIKEIGSATSGSRTQAQTDLARFWIATAPQNWNPPAREVAMAQGKTLSENARAFALLNMAGADAFIASWHTKFRYSQWRPVTGIREADIDGNPKTMADPMWTPLLGTPPFPDYIAGHSTFAGAAERVLGCVFGKDPGVTMTLTSATAPGVVEIYTTFTDVSNDVVDARVWGGIHWRTSSVRGQRIGRRIGMYAVHRFLRPSDGRSPCDGTDSESE